MSVSSTLPRDLLEAAFPGQPRLRDAFERQAAQVQRTAATVASGLEATDSIQNATVITLSPNASFTNERVLRLGPGLAADTDDTYVTISIDPEGAAVVEGGYSVLLRSQGVTDLLLPMSGTLATKDGSEILQNKDLRTPKLSGLGDYANDAAAAAGGVPVTGVYRNGSQLMVRVT
jgi:hypothetical protein